MPRRSALVTVLVSAACFATLAVLAVLAYESGARPLPLLAWRFGIAALALAGFLAWRRPGALRAGVAEVPRYALLSLTGYGAASLCFFFALRHASASVVTVLLYTYPAMVSVASAALDREQLGVRRLVALLLTFVGGALAVGIIGDVVRVRPAGVALGLGAAVGYAAFSLLSARLLGSRSRLVPMAYMFGMSSVGIGILALAVGEPLSPVGWTPTVWALLAAIVAIPTLAAVLLYLHGIERLGAPRAAIASTAEPVFTILLAAAVLGERLSIGQAFGAILVMAGIGLAEWPTRSGPEEIPPV